MLTVAVVVAAVAAFFDLRSRRIPNWFTYTILTLALLIAFLLGGEQRFMLRAAGVGVAVPFLVLFYLGLFGGGDVKLMAAIGALAGPFYGMNIALTSLLVGGLCAAVILLWQGRLWSTLAYEASFKKGTDEDRDTAKDSFPFATAIAIATLGWFLYSVGIGV